jgi:hypothetical protein
MFHAKVGDAVQAPGTADFAAALSLLVTSAVALIMMQLGWRVHKLNKWVVMVIPLLSSI